jgi:sirohydrochlorin ferrochelatase
MRHPHLRAADRAARFGQPAQPAAGPPLVAIAHGSADPRAAAAMTDLIALACARAAAQGGPGLDARVAFLSRAGPAPAEVLAELADGERPGIVVLPLLLTAAFHSRTDIPGVLRQVQASRPGLTISYGQPLGPHPALLRALERRLAEAGQHGHPGGTAVVLAAAGSSQPAANAAVARMAAAWQEARGWRAVVPAYASAASPSPGQAVTALLRDGAARVVVASYLLAPGKFADRVREAALAAGAAAVCEPLAAAPEVADVLLERYTQARARLADRCPGPAGRWPGGHRRGPRVNVGT